MQAIFARYMAQMLDCWIVGLLVTDCKAKEEMNTALSQFSMQVMELMCVNIAYISSVICPYC